MASASRRARRPACPKSRTWLRPQRRRGQPRHALNRHVSGVAVARLLLPAVAGGEQRLESRRARSALAAAAVRVQALQLRPQGAAHLLLARREGKVQQCDKFEQCLVVWVVCIAHCQKYRPLVQGSTRILSCDRSSLSGPEGMSSRRVVTHRTWPVFTRERPTSDEHTQPAPGLRPRHRELPTFDEAFA
jgi:hypothetical protein